MKTNWNVFVAVCAGAVAGFAIRDQMTKGTSLGTPLRNPQQAAFIEAAQRLFLKGYRARRPLPDQPWLGIYQAASLLKISRQALAYQIRELGILVTPSKRPRI